MTKKDKFVNISEASKILGLVTTKKEKPSNHILRFWEKEFKQIKPTILNKRRYYSLPQTKLIKLIKFLLKDQGMTIKGVKNILKSNIKSLDDYNSYSLKAEYQLKEIKSKSKIILEKIKNIKKYGKKNTY